MRQQLNGWTFGGPESLRHVSFTEPGIRRVRSGTGFRYLNPDGRPNRSGADLARIRSLAIPPAWTDVGICRWANGHLQAVGRDVREYLYHPL
ncbi:MAG: DNA topoisomerase IB, partial [Candidatus Riflebacteria bacterium]|nr:DNA topoisomerase IB [Candidatus Riflebacteria bacterium]